MHLFRERDGTVVAPLPKTAAPEELPGAPDGNRNCGHVQALGQTAARRRPTSVSEKSRCRSWGNRAPTSPGLRPTGHRRF